jgi:regulatory protein
MVYTHIPRHQQPWPVPDGQETWHKNGAMRRRTPSPLDEVKLRELALAYVGRFATSRARLRAYLKRKLRERGWAEERPPDPEAIAERFADQGYIDDSAYALMKSRALSSRGYGKRRVVTALKTAGIEEEDGRAAFDEAEREAVAAALRFAERRRIGPFASRSNDDPHDREKAIAAMVRAGHSFALARTIASMNPGISIDMEELSSLRGY